MGRPSGVVGRTQLKQDDLVRIQTLSRDARMGPSEIRRVTGYSIHQIKYALKKKTPTVGKRSGRPRKGEVAPRKKKAAEAGAAGDGQIEQLGPPVSQDESAEAGEGSGELSVELNNQAPGQVGQQELGRLDDGQQHVPDQTHQQQQYQQFQEAQQSQQLQQQEQQHRQPDQSGQAFQPPQP
ncbi:uncharacterized protein P884DRAFT_231063 [Thermothelomyces heterothallicus CBS 202.75]|uniref:uncharacterized protein n=1 Tax=Thermothelomyces heterothallicus CBS 202.75 TaxID=1149848 RepID=UPI0037434A5A